MGFAPEPEAVMSELTLESLAARVAELERKMAALSPPDVIMPTRPWQSVVGISEETEFSRLWMAEMAAARDAEQKALDEEAANDRPR
jgi:hypothetical protein